MGGYEWGRTELALYALRVLLHALVALQALLALEALPDLLAQQVLPVPVESTASTIPNQDKATNSHSTTWLG